jgi:hypothetical protein
MMSAGRNLRLWQQVLDTQFLLRIVCAGNIVEINLEFAGASAILLLGLSLL